MSINRISRYFIQKRLDYHSSSFSEKDSKLLAYRNSNFQDKDLRRQVVGAAVDPRHYNSIPLVAALRDIHILTTPWLPISFESISRRFMATSMISVIEVAMGHVFESGWGKAREDQRLKHLSLAVGDLQLDWGTDQQRILHSFGFNPHGIPAKHHWDKNPEWFFGRYHEVVEGILREVAVKICEKYSNDPWEKAKLLSLALIVKNSFQQELRAIIPQAHLSDMEIEVTRQLTDPTREEALPWVRSAYHFTRKDLIESVLRHGLDIRHFPEGAEQPHVICFNNFQRAGVADVTLGFSGYYVKDLLLRVPLDCVRSGYRPISQELGDYSADYHAERVPVEKIAVVDPFNSTQAVPLSDFRSPA